MNRWFFWVLAPAMLGAALLVETGREATSVAGQALRHGSSLALICATVGLASPGRMGWALKIVALLVVMGCSAHVASEFLDWRRGEPLRIWWRDGEATLVQALLAFVLFAVPAIAFVLRGRTGTMFDVLISPPGEDDPTGPPVAG